MSKQTNIHHLHRAPQLRVTGQLRVFPAELAASIGVNESIILSQIIHLMRHNQCRPISGRLRVKGGVRPWCQILPWLSRNAVHTAIKHLRDEGYIDECSVSGETWYGLDLERCCTLPGLEMEGVEVEIEARPESGQGVTNQDGGVTFGDEGVPNGDAPVTIQDSPGVTKGDTLLIEKNLVLELGEKSREEERIPPNPPQVYNRYDPANGFPTLEQALEWAATPGVDIPLEIAKKIFITKTSNGWIGANGKMYAHWGYAMLSAYNYWLDNNNHNRNSNGNESASDDEVLAEARAKRATDDSSWGYGAPARRAANG